MAAVLDPELLELALVADEEAMGFKGAAFLVEDSVMHRVKVDVRDNRRARRVRTQMGIIRRLTAVVEVPGAAGAWHPL